MHCRNTLSTHQQRINVSTFIIGTETRRCHCQHVTVRDAGSMEGQVQFTCTTAEISATGGSGGWSVTGVDAGTAAGCKTVSNTGDDDDDDGRATVDENGNLITSTTAGSTTVTISQANVRCQSSQSRPSFLSFFFSF
jgi:hypothetical protein